LEVPHKSKKKAVSDAEKSFSSMGGQDPPETAVRGPRRGRARNGLESQPEEGKKKGVPWGAKATYLVLVKEGDGRKLAGVGTKPVITQ